MSRPTSVFLSAENLRHNVGVIKAAAPGKKIIAMLKANAYGHGIRSVGMRIVDLVDAFGVASIDEALALRGVGIEIDILLNQGVFAKDELLVAAENRCSVVFHDIEQIRWIEEADKNIAPNSIKAWIKVDTGLGRLGFLPHELEAVRNRLMACNAIHKTIGLMSHLANSNDLSDPSNEHQAQLFSKINHNGPQTLAKSAAILTNPKTHYEYVRPGIAIYGASPLDQKNPADLQLRPVMHFASKIIATKTLPAGHGVGYGHTHVCKTPTRIGIISAGYGDGYSRNFQNGTPVLVDGVRCPLIGRVSMDMCTVSLENCPNAHVGSDVTLWGPGLLAEEIAPWANTTPYALLTGIQPRLPFVWSSNS